MGNDTFYKIAGVNTVKIKMFDRVVINNAWKCETCYRFEQEYYLIKYFFYTEGHKYIGESGVFMVIKGALVVVVMKGC